MIPTMDTTLTVQLAGLVLIGLAFFAFDVLLRRHAKLQTRLAQACGLNGEAEAKLRGEDALMRRLRAAHEAFLRTIGAVPLTSAKDRETMKDLLAAAGFRQIYALQSYLAIKMTSSLCGLIAGLAWSLFHAGGFGLMTTLLIAGAGAVVGGLLPELVVKFIKAQRYRAIQSSLPDAIDLMTIAANAGQSLDVALARVAKEIEGIAPALADELQVTTNELRALSNRRDALDNLAARVSLPTIRSITATLVQTIRYGTPLSRSLKTLSQEMRTAKVLEMEERAARLPALLALPLMTMIMPSVFIVTAGPGVLTLIEVLSK